jgi:hypothetical protein
VENERELSLFLTTAKADKKEGRVAFARTTDGGLTWELVSWITEEHGGFDIMPSSLRLSETELLTVIRRRMADRQDLLIAYRSTDNGKSWRSLKNPVNDTGNGGSPPALVKLDDGRLALGYIYRSVYGSRVCVRFSSDNGESWSDEIVLRSGMEPTATQVTRAWFNVRTGNWCCSTTGTTRTTRMQPRTGTSQQPSSIRPLEVNRSLFKEEHLVIAALCS